MKHVFSPTEKKPALIVTTSATSRIIHPPEDISLVSLQSLTQVTICFRSLPEMNDIKCLLFYATDKIFQPSLKENVDV